MSTLGGVAFHPMSTSTAVPAGARPAGFFFAPQTAAGALGVVAAPPSNSTAVAGTAASAVPAGSVELLTCMRILINCFKTKCMVKGE